MEIVDIHTHPRYPDRFSKPPEEMASITLARMDRAGIAISGILGHVDPHQSIESVRQGNNYTAATIKACPSRFFGLCFINPAHPSAFIEEEIDRCMQNPGFRGIKLEVDVNCRDPRLDLVLLKAIEHDAPVLHHAWYINPWLNPNDPWQANRSEPHDIAHLARRHPQAKIIMPHLEGCGIRGILDVAELENVWIDTSGAQPFTGTLEFAVEAIGSSRILFGSDMFIRSLASQLGRVFGSAIEEEDREKILHLNARSLFGLPKGANRQFAQAL